MEGNSKEERVMDAAVIGGGFKGMMAAYGLMKQGRSVCIIDKAAELGGFMSPMVWQCVEVDKGPQYLDGISGPQKAILDEIMGEHEPLESLNYSYGSFWNGVYTEGFAIPDYRTLDKQDKAMVLFESVIREHDASKADTISDLFDDSSQKSFSYIRQWCNKFFQNDPDRLSALNTRFGTFFGRKLLFDNELSLELKKTPLFDDILAANKLSIDHRTHNLYPLGRNLGYFRKAFVDTLEKSGVTSLTGCEVTGINSSEDGFDISLGDKGGISAREIYCAATIESTEQLLLQQDTISDYIQPVAQVFYLLEVDLGKDLPFYIMNYSEDSIARVTNFTAYANRPDSGRSILCVEVPTTVEDAIWLDPDSHFSSLRKELENMGIDPGGIREYQAFKVTSTYRTVLRGYEEQFENIIDRIEKRYGGSVHVLTPHLLTRASIMADLSERGILQV